MSLSEDEKISLKNNKHSKIIFLDGFLKTIGMIFMQIPWVNSGVGSYKDYEAMKDFLKWHGFSRKFWVPILIGMQNSYLGALKNDKD